MRVSVIVPVFNGANFICEALESALSQTLAPSEIVVVDDGSQDATPTLVAGYPVVRLGCQRQGPAAARNLGVAASQGELLAFLDCDDLWSPGHLERAVAALHQCPRASIAQGRIQRMQLGPAGFTPDGSPYFFVNLGSLVVRRQAFELLGGLNADLWENEDTDWMMRAWEHSLEKVFIPQVSLFYRLHDSNMVHSQNLLAGGVASLMRGHLHRKRQGLLPTPSPQRWSWDLYRGGPSAC